MKCRLWWPSDISRPPVNYSLLFGWFLHSSRSSFDVVIAFCCNEMGIVSSGHGGFDLEEILKKMNKAMPFVLQQKCKFSVLGHCEADIFENFELTNFQNGKTNSAILNGTPVLHNCERWGCGCLRHEGKLKQIRLLALENFWIRLVLGLSNNAEGRVSLVPKVDHLHFNNEITSHLDLHGQNARDYSCVEFAEKAELKKHSIWSNLVVDILLGNLFGIILWVMADPLFLWLSYFANDFTSKWLRSGCVWLMGNPAGFKLNTELAGVLGMISLNTIQIWCTLAIFITDLVVPFIRGLALFGAFFGLTSAVALISDMISLATLHVSTLHFFFSLIYSTQIHALTALWRLLRGRKYNPLRHRLDSYEYTVDQHVVGSLLFTPILLLLPTTSAFYIFFTISQMSLTVLYILVEAGISVFHSTPYAIIFMWLKRIQRFPCGIWFDVLSIQTSEKNTESSKSSTLFFHIRSNFSSFGNLISPHYATFCSSYSKSCVLPIAHAILTGTSIRPSRGSVYPMKLQWLAIPWKEYWFICHDSVYACRLNPHYSLS